MFNKKYKELKKDITDINIDLDLKTKRLENALESLQNDVDRLERIIKYSKQGEVTYYSMNAWLNTFKATPYKECDGTYFYVNNQEYFIKGLDIQPNAEVKLKTGSNHLVKIKDCKSMINRKIIVDLRELIFMITSEEFDKDRMKKMFANPIFGYKESKADISVENEQTEESEDK